MSKLIVPNELRYLKGLRFKPLSLIDFNSFELEDILPGLFYLIRRGRQRGRGSFSAISPSEMARMLADDVERFEGANSDRGRAILEAWLRTSVLRMGSGSKSHKVMSVRPLHFMSYRADLPPNWINLRSVPEFIAVMLYREDARRGEQLGWEGLFPLEKPANLFVQTFGVGLAQTDTFPKEPGSDTYDDSVSLDIESLLLVRLMTTATAPQPVTVRGQGEIKPFQPLCPAQAKRFRDDFSLFLRCYTPDAVPPTVLGDFVLALLSLNLTIYFITHCLAANALYKEGTLKSDKTVDGTRVLEPAIFVDLTNGQDRKCRELARLSYHRHARMMMEHLRTMVGFRILERTLANAKHIPEIKALRWDSFHAIERFECFAQARLNEDRPAYHMVQAYASGVINQLEEHDQRNIDFFGTDALTTEILTPFDRLIEGLVLSESELAEHVLRFHRSAARLGHHASILARPTARRLDSYYTLTSGMLDMLVHLVPLRANRNPGGHLMDVYEFVDEVRMRYGIWIDKPPSKLDQSIEAHQAAKANMEALKERLRQLGALRSVTDARGMQWVIPRYRSEAPAQGTT